MMLAFSLAVLLECVLLSHAASQGFESFAVLDDFPQRFTRLHIDPLPAKRGVCPVATTWTILPVAEGDPASISSRPAGLFDAALSPRDDGVLEFRHNRVSDDNPKEAGMLIRVPEGRLKGVSVTGRHTVIVPRGGGLQEVEASGMSDLHVSGVRLAVHASGMAHVSATGSEVAVIASGQARVTVIASTAVWLRLEGQARVDVSGSASVSGALEGQAVVAIASLGSLGTITATGQAHVQVPIGVPCTTVVTEEQAYCSQRNVRIRDSMRTTKAYNTPSYRFCDVEPEQGYSVTWFLVLGVLTTLGVMAAFHPVFAPLFGVRG